MVICGRQIVLSRTGLPQNDTQLNQSFTPTNHSSPNKLKTSELSEIADYLSETGPMHYVEMKAVIPHQMHNRHHLQQSQNVPFHYWSHQMTYTLHF